MPETKILRGRESICRYLDNMSKNSFYKWVQLGMPVYKPDGLEWMSNTDALNKWVEQKCENERYCDTQGK